MQIRNLFTFLLGSFNQIFQSGRIIIMRHGFIAVVHVISDIFGIFYLLGQLFESQFIIVIIGINAGIERQRLDEFGLIDIFILC